MDYADKFKDLSVLRDGSPEQQRIFTLLKMTGILDTLADFTPVVAGTFPLDIQCTGSDVDILCEFSEPEVFRKFIEQRFGHHHGFSLHYANELTPSAIVASFEIQQQQFEVFGQALPVTKQMGYRHMLIEDKILAKQGVVFKERVIALKNIGVKTEPAFCQLLGIEGDPYIELLTKGDLYT